MKWILIAMSLGSYNHGTISGIEFESKKACNDARDVMKQRMKYADTICVPKGEPEK